MSEAALTSGGGTRPITLRLAGDDRLARLAAAGSREAFAAIYERHHQAIYRYCHSILGNSEDAADALQNTMASAMQALAGEEREIAIKPWLYRIAHNEAITLIRRRRPQEEIEAAEGSAGPDFDATTETRARLRELVSDLDQLPERQRGALLMRELNGLSYAEVADAFAVSVDAAKRTVFEARSTLHEFSAGRSMDCEAIRSSISGHDGRVLRGRRVRAHLRDCAGCRDFRSLIAARGAALPAIAPPLPAAAAAALLERLLGGGGSGGGGIAEAAVEASAQAAGSAAAPVGAASVAASAGSASAGGGLTGWLSGAGGVLGIAGTTKGIAAVAAVVAVGAGAGGIATRVDAEDQRVAQRGGHLGAAAGPDASNRVEDGADGPAGTTGQRGAEVRRENSAERREAGDDGRRAGDAPRVPVTADGRARTRPGSPGGDERARSRAPAGGGPPGAGDSPAGAPRGAPPAAEEYSGDRIPEQGPGDSDAPAPAAPPIPEGSLPDGSGGQVPDVAPDQPSLREVPTGGPATGR